MSGMKNDGQPEICVPCVEKFQVQAVTDLSKPYIFVSYCHKNTPQVCKLLKLMKDNHFRFWYDEGIASGAEWGDVLYERITNCTQFVCFLTKDAVQSAHVKNEVHIASKYGRRILPVFLDDVELRGALELSLDRQQSLVSTHYEETEFYQRLCAVLDPQAIEKIVTSAGTAQEELDKRYRLHKKIGGGFSGTVYLSENLRTGGNVIVKHGTVDSSYTGDAIRQSYMAECMALSQQISSFSPIVFDLIADEHNIFLAETVAPGISINKLSGLSDHDVAQIILKAAKILKSFHERGLIHCDIKPEHIFCHDGEVFLIDFGACRQIGQLQDSHVLGSHGYAAPECYGRYVGPKEGRKFENLDGRVDIFALGRCMMFTLARMHGIVTPLDMEKTQVLDQSFFSADRKVYAVDQERYRSEISPLIRAVVDKMTCKDRGERFHSMDEVIDCLKVL